MLKIKINKDIDGYAEGILMGLSMKEIGHFLLIAVAEIVIVFLLSLIFHFLLAVYLSIPFVIILSFMGRKIGGVSLKEIIDYWPVYKQLKKGVEYQSTENIEHVMDILESN